MRENKVQQEENKISSKTN